MIWSIMPQELVFPAQSYFTPYQKTCYLNRQVMVMDYGGKKRIVALISSDPADYLDPRFSPGKEF